MRSTLGIWSFSGLDDVGSCVNSFKVCDPNPGVNQVTGCEEDEECRPLSCNYGCFVSRDLKWLAIADGPPTVDGFNFRIGQVKDGMEFELIKDLVLKNKIDFQFVGKPAIPGTCPGTGEPCTDKLCFDGQLCEGLVPSEDRLYYSEKAECLGASCQYTVSYIDLNTTQTAELFVFPPESQIEDSTYKGHFKASPDGDNLILLNTTIRSVAVHLWKFGTGLIQLDFICKSGTQDNCEGTGSEYNDQDPVAISPDSRYAVFFTFSDRWQRARVYDLKNPGTIFLAVLASVPSGSYIEHACDFGVLEPWQWPRVIGDPEFTPDGSEVVFLTDNSCAAPNGTLPKKSQRQIMRVKLQTLVDGKTLTESDVLNVTKNPFGDVKDNILITGFRISPDGATLAFTGSPIVDQSGEPLKDTSSRHRNDREVFRMTLSGGNLKQLTNDPSWEAQSPTVVPK